MKLKPRRYQLGGFLKIPELDKSVFGVKGVSKPDLPEVSKDTPTKPTSGIFSMNNDDLLADLEGVQSDRFSKKYVKSRYDAFDKDIMKAVEDLKLKGERANPNFIKAIMGIESGMVPRKNSKGYDGFPQTNETNLKYINKKYNTDFTRSDLYDAKRSAEFIHYFIKDVVKSRYVKSDEDIIMAYNWGVGNLAKYKKGQREIPEETSNYVKLFNTFKRYF
jgi:soluble lytic murein transglycosylase-like protein